MLQHKSGFSLACVGTIGTSYTISYGIWKQKIDLHDLLYEIKQKNNVIMRYKGRNGISMSLYHFGEPVWQCVCLSRDLERRQAGAQIQRTKHWYRALTDATEKISHKAVGELVSANTKTCVIINDHERWRGVSAGLCWHIIHIWYHISFQLPIKSLLYQHRMISYARQLGKS